MTAIEDAAERAVAAVILFGDLNTAADIRKAAKIVARNVVSEVEPLIRADEREKSAWVLAQRSDELLHLGEHLRASLCAKVEALQAQPFAQVGASGWDSISRADVLALIGGSSNG